MADHSKQVQAGLIRAKVFWDEYNSPPYPTYQEIGDRHGLSRERVRQLVKRWEDHNERTS
jgi:DNA-directed RNA polymerase sigma subunit (sigma70/sigma32)